MSEDVAATESGIASRRALLLGAGAVGATAMLAACGTDDSGDGGEDTGTGDTSAPTTAGETTGAGSGGATVVAKVSDVPVGGGAVFASQGVVVTQPTEGTFKGYSSTCTHMGCPLASVDGGTINCTCHGSKFSIEDGSVKNPPASKPLAEKAVRQDGDNIVLA